MADTSLQRPGSSVFLLLAAYPDGFAAQRNSLLVATTGMKGDLWPAHKEYCRLGCQLSWLFLPAYSLHPRKAGRQKLMSLTPLRL
jgi:hypothetical protein